MKDDRPTSEIDVYPATVVEIVDKNRVVINRGSLHNIKIGTEFMIYSISDEDIIDPTSGQSLGKLEYPKDTGEVINVQENLATIETNMETEASRVIKKDPLFYGREQIEVNYKKIPFDYPEIGDKAKPI